MGGAACVVIIDGNKAYAAVENLADRLSTINTYYLSSAINASCEVVSYTSLYLISKGEYLSTDYTDPIIALHRRIIDELPVVTRKDAQHLVDELAHLLFAASENIISLT